MIMHNVKRLLYGMAGVIVAAGVTYACKDFLDAPPQGTVDEQTLATKVGVEGSLIAAYRSLDCSSSSAGSWGCAASNWVWGSVTGNDYLTGRVDVCRAANLTACGAGARGVYRFKIRTEDRGHRARPHRHGLLHVTSARPHRLECVAQR